MKMGRGGGSWGVWCRLEGRKMAKGGKTQASAQDREKNGGRNEIEKIGTSVLGRGGGGLGGSCVDPCL